MPRGRLIVRAGALLAVAGATAAIVVIAAYGGHEAPPPTRAEYIAQVDAICEEYGRRLDAVRPPTDLSSPGAVVESLQHALPILTAQADEVRGLRRPPELRRKLERFFRLTDSSLADLQQALDHALERALYPMAVALTDFGEDRDAAKVIARSIGFHC